MFFVLLLKDEAELKHMGSGLVKLIVPSVFGFSLRFVSVRDVLKCVIFVSKCKLGYRILVRKAMQWFGFFNLCIGCLCFLKPVQDFETCGLYLHNYGINISAMWIVALQFPCTSQTVHHIECTITYL